MTCCSKIYILLPCVEGTGVISHGPYSNLPNAREAAERLKRRWSKLQHHTPTGQPSIRIVKVIEDIYIRGSE